MALVPGKSTGPSKAASGWVTVAKTPASAKSTSQLWPDRIIDSARVGKITPTVPDDWYQRQQAAAKKPSGAKSESSLTAEQKKQAQNLKAIAEYNAQSVRDQLARATAQFDRSDAQHRALAAEQQKQNSRSMANDRFNQLRKLQFSAKSAIGNSGNALQGSQAGNIAEMLRSRNDMDSSEALGTLATNQNAVFNSLADSINQNAVSRMDAESLAENMIREIEADTAAQLNNINQKLYVAPGKGDLNMKSKTTSKVPAMLKPESAGYITSAPTGGYSQTSRSNTGSSYFDRLMSGYGRA